MNFKKYVLNKIMGAMARHIYRGPEVQSSGQNRNYFLHPISLLLHANYNLFAAHYKTVVAR